MKREIDLSLKLDLIHSEENQQAEISQPLPRSGDNCPRCGIGRLDYDGLLNLACPECSYSLGGCFS